jgi:hypothetical protein
MAPTELYALTCSPWDEPAVVGRAIAGRSRNVFRCNAFLARRSLGGGGNDSTVQRAARPMSNGLLSLPAAAGEWSELGNRDIDHRARG